MGGDKEVESLVAISLEDMFLKLPQKVHYNYFHVFESRRLPFPCIASTIIIGVFERLIFEGENGCRSMQRFYHLLKSRKHSTHIEKKGSRFTTGPMNLNESCK